MSQEETVFETGEVVADRYEIVEELGRGSYGVVYRAVQLGIERDVAIKTLLPDTEVGSEEQQRFEQEALLISRLNHPNIVTLFDYGEHQGVLFMAMEFVAGRNLKEVIDEEAPLEASRVRALTYQMLDALQFAHDQGVVHRDLKPENIQLLRNPSMEASEPDALKILDFGIAKVVHGSADGSPLDRLTQTGVAMGTPQYMSPENITGDQVSHHADLYAVGLLLYEMLTGEPAFSAPSPREVMVKHIRDEAPHLPEGSAYRPFDRALAHALKKQPDERVQSARELRDILEEDAPVEATRKGATDRGKAVGPSSSVPAPLVAVVVAAAVVLALLVVYVVQDEGRDDSSVEQVVIVEQGERQDGEEAEIAVGAADEERVDGGERRDPVEDRAEHDGELDIPDGEQRSGAEIASEGDDGASESVESQGQREGRNGPDLAEDDGIEAAQGGGEGADEVELEILTRPTAARVSIDGRPLGVSPLSHRMPRSDEPIELGFSLMGYNDRVQTVVPDESQTVEVELERGRLQLD